MSVYVKPGRGHIRKGYLGEAGIFAVYAPDLDKIYIVPVDAMPNGSKGRLRLKRTKNNQEKGILWAKDYEL